MNKVLNILIEAGSGESNEPRLRGWHRNTHLCVDVKSFLRRDGVMKIEKSYPGLLTRDLDDHFNFVETQPQAAFKRNPQVFRGEYITITRKDDGTYRPNFRPMPKGKGFCVERYASEVANELLLALEGLVGD